MSTLLKKILFLLVILTFLFSINLAAANGVSACTTNFECAVNSNADGCVPNPNTGSGQQKSICSTAVTTAVNNAVQSGLNSQVGDIYNLWNHKWYSEQNPFEWYKKVYDDNTSPDSEIFGERYTAAQVQWVIYGVFSYIWNLIPGNPQLTICILGGDIQQCSDTIQKYFDALNPIGDAGSSSNTAGVFSVVGQNPISGVYYFKNLASKFTLVSPVNAQGVGFTSANSILSVWRIARNISYALMVVAIIILAFMIMFRVKINPQVVISVQSAIPRLAITLLLVTFSYAIAGLAIDLMYVVIGLLSVFLSSGGLTSETAPKLFQDFVTRNSFALMYSYWGHFVVSTASTMFSGSGLGILVFLFSILAILAVLWWSIQIIWMVIKTFAMVLLTIAVGPLEIMLGAVTEASGFGTWFKRLLSHLAVYPTMCLMFFLAFFFLHQGDDASSGFASTIPFNPSTNTIGANTWLPPMSFLATSGSRLVWVLVSFVIFSEIPKISKIVQSFIEGKQYEFGTAIGEHVGGTGRIASQYAEMAKAGTVPEGGRAAQILVSTLKWLALIK